MSPQTNAQSELVSCTLRHISSCLLSRYEFDPMILASSNFHMISTKLHIHASTSFQPFRQSTSTFGPQSIIKFNTKSYVR